MAISLQADSTLPQGYILVDGQRVASVSTTGGLSATLAANTVTTSSLVDGSVTPQKLSGSIVSNLPAGSVIQTLQVSTSSVIQIGPAPTTNVMPVDQVPTLTMGVQLLSATITPLATNNKVLIRFNAHGLTSSGSVNTFLGGVIFRNNIPIQSVYIYETQNGVGTGVLQGEFLDNPNTVSSINYQIRLGIKDNEDIAYINGGVANGVPIYGNTSFSTLTIQEIKG